MVVFSKKRYDIEVVIFERISLQSIELEYKSTFIRHPNPNFGFDCFVRLFI